MEENQLTNQEPETNEPEISSDNSNVSANQNPEVASGCEGKSNGKTEDPSNLILGKFKSQDDLINAYQELQKLQGTQSAELGQLRGNASMIHNIENAWARQSELRLKASELQETAQKYNTPEYFQDPSFKEMYKEAFLALGNNLDTDRFVNLLEGYVSSRIMQYESGKAAKTETENALGSVKFAKNKNTSLKSTGKRLDEMTPQEIDDLLDKYI